VNALRDIARRAYEPLVTGANVLQSPLLLALRVYFFWQLFLTGKGKLSNIGKVSEFFTSLGRQRSSRSRSEALGAATPNR
jgi:hypothetical protein